MTSAVHLTPEVVGTIMLLYLFKQATRERLPQNLSAMLVLAHSTAYIFSLNRRDKARCVQFSDGNARMLMLEPRMRFAD